MVDWPYSNQRDAATILGSDDSNNGFASTNVAANADGSVIERQEYLQTTQAVPTADATTDTLMRDVVGKKNDAAVTTVGTQKSLMAYLKGCVSWLTVAVADAVTNAAAKDVIGNKEDAAVTAVGTTKSIIAYAKGLLNQIGTLVNTGGTATLGGIIGDLANSSLVTRLNLLQGQTPATYVPGLGFKVSKTEDVNVATGDDLFTVTGKVLITLWTGEVTNALAAGVTDYKLRVKTDDIDLCAASNIGSAAIGFLFQMNSDAGDTLINTASALKTADTNGKGIANRVVGKAGGSDVLQSNRTAGDAGDAIVHTIWYLPLEAGAAVAAAA